MEALKKGDYSGLVETKKVNDGLIASITRYDQDHFNGELHYHINLHFGFTVDGGCIEKKRASYELGAGDISCYLSEEKHQVMHIASPSRRVNLELERSFMDMFELSEETVSKTVCKNPDAKFIMVNIFRELVVDDENSWLAIQMMLLNLFYQSEGLTKTRKPAWLNLVCDYLYVNWRESLTLTEVGKIAGVHPVTISKYFPVYMGCNLGEYMRKLKVEKSLSLIKGSNASLTDISYQCGFFDQSHFSRNFKNLNGVLPLVYKKM